MIVSSATLPDFGPERSRVVIGGLTRLLTELEPSPPPGFLHSMLLRPEGDKKGSAVLLTMWESQADLGRFVSSKEGAAMARRMAELIGDGAKGARGLYFVTWQSEVYQPRSATRCCAPKDGRTQS